MKNHPERNLAILEPSELFADNVKLTGGSAFLKWLTEKLLIWKAINKRDKRVDTFKWMNDWIMKWEGDTTQK